MGRMGVGLASAVGMRMRFMRMGVRVTVAVVRVLVRLRLMLVRVGIGLRVGVGFMFVRGLGGVRRNDIDFCAGETAADHLADLKARAHVARLGGLCQGIKGDARIDQRAQ